MRVVEGGQVFKNCPTTSMRGVFQTDQITAKSNFGEFSLDGQGGRSRTYAKAQVSMSEPESNSESEFKLAELGVESMLVEEVGVVIAASEAEVEPFPQQVWPDDGYFSLPESSGCVGDSGTPLVCHQSQICRSLLPCR